MAKKYILDIDCSADDFIAAAFVASEPDVQIKAVTIASTGEVNGKIGAQNTAMICHHLGLPNVPIAYGSEKALSEKPIPFPESLREIINDILANKNLKPHANPNVSDNAVELMRKVFLESDDKVTILATGPLTNVAEFVQKYPELAPKIEKIVIMGGAIMAEGNLRALHPDTTNLEGECNIAADQKAAQIVFTSQVPIVLVALDATNQVPMSMEFYNSLRLSPNEDHQLVYLLLKGILDGFGEDMFVNHFYLWDPLAAMISVQPEMATYYQAAITVHPETGKTNIAENAPVASRNVQVAEKILEPKHVLKKLVECIARRLARDQVDVLEKTPQVLTAFNSQSTAVQLNPVPAAMASNNLQKLLVNTVYKP